jgi:hypothetical protein
MRIAYRYCNSFKIYLHCIEVCDVQYLMQLQSLPLLVLSMVTWVAEQGDGWLS